MPSPVGSLINSYLDAWNRHDVDSLLNCFTDDCYYEDSAFALQNRGKDQMCEFCRKSFRTFPNLRFDVGTVYSSRSGAGWNWTMSGNYSVAIEELRVPATGQAMVVKGASMTRFRKGLIEHNVDYYDSLKFLQQLGAFASQ